jgi:hypothetical protein
MKGKSNFLLFLPLIPIIIILFPFPGYQSVPQEDIVEISGWVTVPAAEGSEGLPGVKLTFTSHSGETVTETTDSQGYYSHQLAEGWGGTVTPSKTGYTFAPGFQPYTVVTTDQGYQDYTASGSPFFSISGRVAAPGNTGLPGVILTFSIGEESMSAETDINGNYSLEVPRGWSGIVTPGKDNYVFTPPNFPYENIRFHRPGQDYTATANSPVISGQVIIWSDEGEGIGLAGVTLGFSNNDGTTIDTSTDANGNYFHAVAPGWSGTVTLSKTGYVFEPGTNSYENVTDDRPGEDYTASAFFPVISGTVTTPVNTGIPGVKLEFTNIDPADYGYTYTNDNGNYIYTVLNGWSGKVTPTKSQYQFELAFRRYDNVNFDFLFQDYKASPVISGRVSTGAGEGVADVLLTFSNRGGSTSTDANGKYIHAVKQGWTGEVTPYIASHTFLPASKEYTEVFADLWDQDYAASEIHPVISGTITKSGAPLPGVTLTFSNSGGTCQTDDNGNYENTVNYGWEGTVTPGKTDWVFLPASQDYANVVSNQRHQDFQAIYGSVTLTLQASGGITGSFLIQRLYGRISLTAEVTSPDLVSHYIIYKQDQDGTISEFENITHTELQNKGGTHTIIDRDIEPGKIYTYEAWAIHSTGYKIKESGKKQIQI